MTKDSLHPDTDQLRDFALGRLGEKVWSEIERHLAICDRCAQQIKKIPDNDDAFLQALKQIQPQPNSFELTSVFDEQNGTAFHSSKGNKTLRDDVFAHAESTPKKLGQYELGPEIGRGGMGVVYLAKEQGLERQVALKVLPRSTQLRAADKQRFRIEAQAAAQLNHDNIVPVYQVGEADDTQYYSMKLIDGSDLGQLIQHARRSVSSASRQLGTSSSHRKSRSNTKDPDETAKVTYADTDIDLSGAAFSASLERRGHRSATRLSRSAARIGEQVAEALSHAHQRGVIHRDIKPSNLLLDQRNRVWVTDFGLAHLQDSPSLTRTGDLIGTLRYMSPEQASGRRALVDHRTDIYSLGVTLFELVTLEHACRGKNPRDIIRELTFERPTPIRKLNPRLPRDFETIICKATERNPADRYQSADEMAVDLRQFVHAQPLRTRRTSKWKHARDWLYERPLFSAALGAAVLMVMATLTVSAGVLNSRLNLSQGRRWRAESALALSQDHDPGSALAMALKAAGYTRGYATEQSILSALEDLREAKRIDLGDAQIGQIVFSPDGKRLLKCLDRRFYSRNEGSAVVLDPDTGERLFEFDSARSITTAVFSPNGATLLTAGILEEVSNEDKRKTYSHGPATVWDANALDRVPRVLTRTRVTDLTSNTFSGDASRAVFPAADGNQVLVYNTEDWTREALVLQGLHSAPVLQAIFSPDGKYIATWSIDGVVGLWNGIEGSQLASFDYDEGRLPLDVRLAFSQSSHELAVGGWSGTKVYSTATRQETGFHFEKDAKYAGDKLILKTYQNDAIRIVRNSGIIECRSELPLGDFVSVGQQGILAATVFGQPFVRLFANGKTLADCYGHDDIIRDLKPRPSANQFATISWDNTIRIWNTATNSELRRIGQRPLELSQPTLTHSSDGQQTLATSVDGMQCMLGQLADPKLVDTLNGKIELLLKDGSILIEEADRLSLINSDNYRTQFSIPWQNERLDEAIELDESNGILLVTESRRLLRWVPQENQLHRMTGDSDRVTDIRVHRPSGTVLAATQDGRVLSFAPNQEQPELVADLKSAVFHLDFDSTWSHLLVTSKGRGAIVYKYPEVEEIATVTSSDFPITAAWFALDDEHIVTHADVATEHLGLWRWQDNEQIATLPVQRVFDFKPDVNRRRFAVASESDGAFVWDLETRERKTVTELPSWEVQFAGHKLLVTTTSRNFPLTTFGSQIPRISDRARLIIWDVSEQQETYEKRLRWKHAELQVAPDETTFAVSGPTIGAALIDIEGTSVVQELYGHADKILLASFLPGDQTAITVSVDGTILVHDLAKGVQTPLGSHEYHLTAATISGDQRQLITSDTSGITRQWDLSDFGLIRELEAPVSNGWATRHLIARDNIQVVSVFSPNALVSWDLRAGVPRVITVDEGVRFASLSPDGRSVLALLGKYGFRVSTSRRSDLQELTPEVSAGSVIIDSATGERKPLEVDEDLVFGRFLPDGQLLAVLTRRGQILLIDPGTRKLVRRIASDTRCTRILSVSSETSTLYAQTQSGVLGWTGETASKRLPITSSVPYQIGQLGDWTGPLITQHPTGVFSTLTVP